jgi:hypothetical protein
MRLSAEANWLSIGDESRAMYFKYIAKARATHDNRDRAQSVPTRPSIRGRTWPRQEWVFSNRSRGDPTEKPGFVPKVTTPTPTPPRSTANA